MATQRRPGEGEGTGAATVVNIINMMFAACAAYKRWNGATPRTKGLFRAESEKASWAAGEGGDGGPDLVAFETVASFSPHTESKGSRSHCRTLHFREELLPHDCCKTIPVEQEADFPGAQRSFFDSYADDTRRTSLNVSCSV